MESADWEGFGIRLGRAIDRWTGGGQRAFADALRDYAERHGVRIPTSYRTLVNYLNGTTRPSEAWVQAAADVLRWNPENLLTGQGPEREAGKVGVLFERDRGVDRSKALSELIVGSDQLSDLPVAARMMLLSFVSDYMGDDLDGWRGAENRQRREEQVWELLERFFGSLLTRPRMDSNAVMAFTASLVAAAYVRASAEPYQPSTADQEES